MGGGYVPDENENGQLLQAIKEIIADNIPPEKVRTTLAEYGITDAYTKAVTYTKEEIEAKLKNLSALPVGAMVPFPRGTVPAGFLEANGDSFNPDTYPDLAAYLGGNTLPDTRGEFLRGWDHGAGWMPGAQLPLFSSIVCKAFAWSRCGVRPAHPGVTMMAELVIQRGARRWAQPLRVQDPVT